MPSHHFSIVEAIILSNLQGMFQTLKATCQRAGHVSLRQAIPQTATLSAHGLHRQAKWAFNPAHSKPLAIYRRSI